MSLMELRRSLSQPVQLSEDTHESSTGTQCLSIAGDLAEGRDGEPQDSDVETPAEDREAGAFHTLSHIRGYAATASKVIGRLAAQRGMDACGSQSSALDG